MDETIRERIIRATLKYIPMEGWSNQALYQGIQDAGSDSATMHSLFPDGISDLILSWGESVDRRMLETMESDEYQACPTTASRIGYLLFQRLRDLESEREASRQLFAYLLLPLNSQLGARMLRATVDAIWYGVGDRSVDFSYYSKRLTLASIIMVTTVYWLNSRSPEETRSFIDKTIQAAMTVGKVKRRLNPSKFFSLPLRILQAFQRRSVRF